MTDQFKFFDLFDRYVCIGDTIAAARARLAELAALAGEG
jgi:hypothetical protein